MQCKRFEVNKSLINTELELQNETYRLLKQNYNKTDFK